MKRLHFPALTAAALAFTAMPVLSQGPLTPPGPPAPTMKTLLQVEPRTDLATVPGSTVADHVITGAGSYYLSSNLDATKGTGIRIQSSNVTLDLNGFTIYRSSSAAASGEAIDLVGSEIRNITIKNGHITSAPLDGTGGSFVGRGFFRGIDKSTGFGGALEPSSILVTQVTVLGGASSGINLSSNAGSSNIVTHCSVRGTGTTGISADEVHFSSALDCGGEGIFSRNLVSHCIGRSLGNSWGIYCAGPVSHSNGSSAEGIGIRSFSTVNYCVASGATSIQAPIAVACTTSGTQVITNKYLMP